ncbi:MAG: hypothetical protein FJZ16_02250 [Candidatus Omnitrophica bacterium]|nr:hypothetical protein [Candidatus Omnitrophota bacterium]
MFKESEQSQLEFFKDIRRPQKRNLFFKKKLGFQRHAITLLVYYENLILFAIAFILILIVTFSIGIERGKKLQMSIQSFNRPSASPIQKNITQPLLEQKTYTKQMEVKKTSDVVNIQGTITTLKKSTSERAIPFGTYLIQVATYTNKKLAEKEKENLLKIGVNSFVVVSGKFYQVKAGPFNNKEDALNLQKRLKRFYRDCYIRRQSST